MKIRKEIKAGLVITLSLGMLIYGLNFLKGTNIFTKTRTIYALYTDVVGVVPSNPVLVSGFHIGQIKDIELLSGTSGKIVVAMQISNKTIRIPKNSVATIVSSDLLGSKAIQITLGNSTAIVEDGDTITSTVETSLKDQVSHEVLPVKEKAEQLMSSIDSTLAIVQGIFTKKVQSNLSESVLSIRNSMKHLESTTGNLDDLVASEKKRITDILEKVDEISGALAKNSKQLGEAVNNMSAISDSIAKSNLKSAINNADSALYYTSKILKKINKGNGSLGMLANDTALYNRVSNASGQLSNLLQDMKAHPKRYVHFSIFGGKN